MTVSGGTVDAKEEPMETEEIVRYEPWMDNFLFQGSLNPFYDDTLFELHVVVACQGTSGPVLQPVVVFQTAEEINDGDHYIKAIELMQTLDVDKPFVAFDEHDNPKLMTLFNWDEALR
jgi:hypothetical protein